MKWISHKICTFSTVYLIFNDVIGSTIAAGMSTFPDAIEGRNNNFNKWKKIHRKMSHWLFGYLYALFNIILISKYIVKKFPWEVELSLQLMQKNILNKWFLVDILLFSFFYGVLGCTLHVIQDSISSRVPTFHPYKRTFGLNLVKTGSFGEFCIVVFFLCLAGLKIMTVLGIKI